MKKTDNLYIHHPGRNNQL